jgi:hypothetical protein
MPIFMYDDVMILVVVPCYLCYVCTLCLFILFLSCLLVTHIFLCTPHFAKLYKKSSHISLGVNCVLFIPCISLGELLVQIWKTKLYYA